MGKTLHGEIRIEEKIILKNPIIIIGLSGWGNAGEVSTFTVKYLTEGAKAKRFGEITTGEFHDYFIQRPIVSIEKGVIQAYFYPRNDLFYYRNKDDESDLILLLGFEPHLNWPAYAEAILKLAVEKGVKRIYTIGGYLADISHEIEPPITASTNNEKIVTELRTAGVELTNYRGPTSVYSEILWRAKEKTVDVISLWCAVPMYVKGVYPEAAYSIIRKITQLTGIEMDLRDLKEKAELFKAQLEKETAEQPQVRDLIENLRRRQQEKEPSYIY